MFKELYEMGFKDRIKNVFINRDFNLFWAGQSVSIFGNYFMFLALPIMTYSITGSRMTLGITITLQAVPALIAGPFAGALVDRWDRRKTMLTADIIRALLLMPILLVKGPALIYVVYSVSFLMSLVGIFFEPAFGAALPRIVGKDNILKANSMVQTSVSIIKILAPLAGTAAYTMWGTGALIAIDMFTFAVSAVTILLIKTKMSVDAEVRLTLGLIARDIAEGVRYISGIRAIVVVLVTFLFLAFFEGIVSVLLLPYIKDVLGAGEKGYGLAISVQGAGQILGSIIIALAGRKINAQKLFVLCFIGTAVMGIPFVNAGSYSMMLPVLLIIGIFIVGLFISANTIIQSRVEDRFLGRVENSLGILFQLGILSTTLLAGIMSELYSIRLVLNAGIALEIVGAIIAACLLKGAIKPQNIAIGSE
jgi:MFS family permease